MRHLAIAAVAALAAGLLAPTTRAQTGSTTTFTYSVDTRGDVEGDLDEFISQTADTYTRNLGWTLGGSVSFERVAEGGDFTLWLAAPEAMESFSSVCDPAFSCRVGDHVIVNDDNWRNATRAWPDGRSLRDYRHMVVNHETGHWLGLDHVECPGTGRLAPLMMQQSKALDGCVANAWPTDEERARVADRLDVPVLIPETLAFGPTPDGSGYRLLESDGSILTFDTTDFGDLGLRTEATDLATAPAGDGHWVLDEAGGVFTFGDAPFHGSIPGLRQDGQAIPDIDFVDLAPTPGGGGYWVLDEAGGVFTFGDAPFHGSIPGLRQDGQPIPDVDFVDLAPTPTGDGYRVLDEAGGVFTFGDASFHGSVPGLRQNGRPIPHVPVTAFDDEPDGDGYWIFDEAGGVFTFGDASFHGSVPGTEREATDVVDGGGTPSGNGYWLMDTRGQVFTFGDAPFHGSGAS